MFYQHFEEAGKCFRMLPIQNSKTAEELLRVNPPGFWTADSFIDLIKHVAFLFSCA